MKIWKGRDAEYEIRRLGVKGVLGKLWHRAWGPGGRELLRRMEDGEASDARRSEALTARLDATLHYLSDKTVRQSEESFANMLAEAETKQIERFARLTEELETLRASLNPVPVDVPAADALEGLKIAVSQLRQEFEAYRRSQAVCIIDPASDTVLVSDYGFDILVPASERALLLHFMRRGLKHIENGVREVIQRCVRPGDTAVDIGANVGLHALLLARIAGPNGHLHAFEPHPVVGAALRQTISINGLTNVSVFDHVVSDAPGEVEFWTGEHSPTSSIFSNAATASRRMATSLDSHFPPGTRVDFVKMDAEGAEPLIWNGMQRVLADNPAIRIVMEVSADHFARSGLDMAGFYGRLREAGFRVSQVLESGETVTVAEAVQFLALREANIFLERGS